MRIHSALPLILLPATLAMAQLEPDEQYMDMSVEELLKVPVSSASLFSESQMQAAASIKKITAAQWNLWGARENHDPFATLSAVESYPTLFGGHALAIRGYTQFLSVRGIATLIDGVPLNDPIFGSAQYDNEHVGLGVLDSIEVIKGPGSTLYGTDAFHGTISLQTYHADTNEIRARAQLGSPRYEALTAQASHVYSDQAIVNAALDMRDQADAWSKGSLLLKLHSSPSADLRYELSAYSNRYKAEDRLGGGRKFGYQINDQSTGDHDLNLGRGEVEINLGEPGHIGLKLARWDLTRNNSFEIASGIFEQLQVIDRSRAETYWQFENETLRLYTGIEYTEENVRRSNQNRIDQLTQAETLQTQVEQGFTRTIRSIFSQGRLKSTGVKGLEWELGFRSDDYSDFGTQGSPRVSAIYSLTPTRVIKAIYSNAFRAAVTLEQYGSTTIRGSSSMRPEELDSYELIWIDGYSNWSYQISGFTNSWKNGIVAVPLTGDPAYTSEFRNNGRNTSQGVEGELRYKWAQTMLTTELASIKSRNNVERVGYNAFPKISGSLQIEHKLDAKQSVQTRALYKDHWRDGTSKVAQKLGPYQRLDAGWMYRWESDRSLNLAVNNLLDRDNHLPSLLDNPGGDPEQSRSFDISLGWAF